MRTGWHISNQLALHFVTFTVVNWVDVFTKYEYAEILLENFRFYRENQGLQIHGYVIMTNHVHAILSATQPQHDLSSLINRFKTFTSKTIIEAII